MADPRTPPPLTHETVGSVLRWVRREAGLKQEELAARLARSQSYVTRIERGDTGVDLAEIQGWCGACGFEVAFAPRPLGAPEDLDHAAARAALTEAIRLTPAPRVSALVDLVRDAAALDARDLEQVVGLARHLADRRGRTAERA